MWQKIQHFTTARVLFHHSKTAHATAAVSRSLPQLHGAPVPTLLWQQNQDPNCTQQPNMPTEVSKPRWVTKGWHSGDRPLNGGPLVSRSRRSPESPGNSHEFLILLKGNLAMNRCFFHPPKFPFHIQRSLAVLQGFSGHPQQKKLPNFTLKNLGIPPEKKKKKNMW